LQLDVFGNTFAIQLLSLRHRRTSALCFRIFRIQMAQLTLEFALLNFCSENFHGFALYPYHSRGGHYGRDLSPRP